MDIHLGTNAYPINNKHMYKSITFNDGTNPGSLNLRTAERLGTGWPAIFSMSHKNDRFEFP